MLRHMLQVSARHIPDALTVDTLDVSTGRQLNWWWEKAVKVCTSDSTAQLWSAPCAAHVLGEVLCVQCCSECMCEAAHNALLEQCRCCGTCACQRTCLCCLSAADLHNCHPFAWCQVLRTHCTGTLAPACLRSHVCLLICGV